VGVGEARSVVEPDCCATVRGWSCGSSLGRTAVLTYAGAGSAFGASVLTFTASNWGEAWVRRRHAGVWKEGNKLTAGPSRSSLMAFSLRSSASHSQVTSDFSLATVASRARRVEFSSRKRRTSTEGSPCSSSSILFWSAALSSCNPCTVYAMRSYMLDNPLAWPVSC
jgi:hypothetical protein